MPHRKPTKLIPWFSMQVVDVDVDVDVDLSFLPTKATLLVPIYYFRM